MAFAYTTRLVGLNRAQPGDVVVYTVPGGITTVVRHLSCRIMDPGYGVLVYFEQPGSSPVTIANLTGALDEVVQLEMRQALNPGDELHVASSAPAFQIAITGYELSRGTPTQNVIARDL